MTSVTDITKTPRYAVSMKNLTGDYPVTLHDLRRDLLMDIARCRALTGADAVSIRPMLADLRQLLATIDEALESLENDLPNPRQS